MVGRRMDTGNLMLNNIFFKFLCCRFGIEYCQAVVFRFSKMIVSDAVENIKSIFFSRMRKSILAIPRITGSGENKQLSVTGFITCCLQVFQNFMCSGSVTTDMKRKTACRNIQKIARLRLKLLAGLTFTSY